MKNIGIGLLIIGTLACIAALNMDTSVATKGRYGLPERAVNFSLIEQRRTTLMLSGLTILIGAILTSVGHAQLPPPNGKTRHQRNETRPCPFCAEEIRRAAIVCKHCQRDVPPEVIDTNKEYEPTEDEQYNYGSPPPKPSTSDLGRRLNEIEERVTKQIQDFCLDESGKPSCRDWTAGILLVVFVGAIAFLGG